MSSIYVGYRDFFIILKWTFCLCVSLHVSFLLCAAKNPHKSVNSFRETYVDSWPLLVDFVLDCRVNVNTLKKTKTAVICNCRTFLALLWLKLSILTLTTGFITIFDLVCVFYHDPDDREPTQISLALFNERDVPEILAEQGGYLKCVSQREDSGFEPQLGSF